MILFFKFSNYTASLKSKSEVGPESSLIFEGPMSSKG